MRTCWRSSMRPSTKAVRMAGERVLVVDDERDVASVISAVLEEAGYDVRTAHDGDDALEAIRRWQPDVVTLDLLMPVRDGFSVLRELRTAPAAMPPVIVCTAIGGEISESYAASLGAAGFIAKPFGLDEVTAAVARVLRRSH